MTTATLPSRRVRTADRIATMRPLRPVRMDKVVFELAAPPMAASGSQQSRIHTANHVIRGVKILGLESKNTARVIGLDDEWQFGRAVDQPYGYTAEALQAAIPLYEGAHVFSNHLKFDFNEKGARVVKGTERQNEDLVGWLAEVRFVPGKGLYGDFHYLASHPLCGRIVEVAAKKPDLMALSHEAFFDNPKVMNGRVLLTRISGVDSVALVSSKPGTTNGLFESLSPTMERTMSKKTTLRKILESTPVGTPGRALLLEAITDQAGAPAPLGNMPIDVPPPPAAPEPGDDAKEKIRQGMLAAVNAKLDTASMEQLRAVLTALQLSDSVAEASCRQPAPTVTEATPGDPNAAVDPSAVAPQSTDDNGEMPQGGQEQVEESTPSTDPEAAPATTATKPAVAVPEGSDSPPPNGPAGAPAADQPWKKPAAQETAAVDCSGLIMECVDICTANGVQPNSVVLEAMASLPTQEKREALARCYAPGSVIPANMRQPRSATVPVAVVQESKTVAESYSEQGSLANAMRRRS